MTSHNDRPTSSHADSLPSPGPDPGLDGSMPRHALPQEFHLIKKGKSDMTSPNDRKSSGVNQEPREVPVWIRVDNAAELLDMTPGAMRKALRRGQIPKELVRHIGRAVRINRQRLLAWLEGLTAA